MIKKLFYVLLIAGIAIFAMTFMYQNQQVVTVRYYELFTWEQRLSVIMVAVFCLGAVLGILFNMLTSLRLRGKLFSTSRKLKRVEAKAGANS